MNPVPLFLIIVSLPLLLGGCGEKHEGVNDNKTEEREGIRYLKGSETPYTGKTYMLDAGTAFFLQQNAQKIHEGNFKDGKKDGLFVEWWENENDGLKGSEINYKDGKMDGLNRHWHTNGQIQWEETYKDGKKISGKYWNSKGESVDSRAEVHLNFK